MDPILNDFESDLDKVVAQLDFIEQIRKFAAFVPPQEGSGCESAFENEAKIIFEASKRVHGNLPLASSTLILYTCGRFEAMTRVLFEDLCQRLVAKADYFARLPKKMRENLPIFTAKVISDPRKYGHAENGVRSFVTTLASNLAINAKVERVNHQCLSITDANMRPDILVDLFGRIGASNILSQISSQALLKAHFQEADAQKVEASIKRKLNELMDLRNKIAHPSGEIDWPSTGTLRDYIDFLKILARSMVEIAGVYEVTLCTAEVIAVKDKIEKI